MFSELPKLLSRDFAIGYYLPAALFLIACLFLLHAVGMSNVLLDASQGDLLGDVTALAVASWFLALLLVSVNTSLIQTLEGYPKGWALGCLFARLRQRMQREYDRHHALRRSLAERRRTGTFLPGEDAAEVERRLIETTRLLAKRFPPEREHVLPTRFGNAVRAFEQYPTVIYGLDAIETWGRIFLLMEDKDRQILTEAKSLVDFWINLWALSLALLVLYGGYVLLAGSAALNPTDFAPAWWSRAGAYLGALLAASWLAALALGLALFAPRQATSAAVDWGDLVKAAFDLHVRALAHRLGAPDQPSQAQLRDLFTRANQVFIYRRPRFDAMPERRSPMLDSPPTSRALNWGLLACGLMLTVLCRRGSGLEMQKPPAGASEKRPTEDPRESGRTRTS